MKRVFATIEEAIDRLRHGFGTEGATSAVLTATPGMGKTTRIPPALLAEDWLNGQKIVLLEPRRAAARTAATYMATKLGETVGETVGYLVRQEQRISARTRIELVTDGVFTRMLQDDPALSGVGLVIFDEFHERHLQSELGLALLLQTQTLFRPDLRILLMSATLDGARLAAWLGEAPLVAAAGRSWPLAVDHSPPAPSHVPERLEQHVARTVVRALAERAGDVLVFLPGVGEIRRAQQQLEPLLSAGVRVLPLHGRLSLPQQAEVLNPPATGERRVILATSLAESSVTVPGVQTVIDSGWSRVNRYSPRTGMERLETVRVSMASAIQRAGRAARLGPGLCIRLWRPEEERTFSEQQTPEVLSSDLTDLALELLVWGVSDVSQLQWLDPPPEAAWQAALETLVRLGAVEPRDDGTAAFATAYRLTEHGKRLTAFGCSTRLASMILRAANVGWAGTACELAARLQERTMSVGERLTDIEFWMRADAGPGVSAERERLRRLLPVRSLEPSESFRQAEEFDWTDRLGILLAWAFPDRIGQKRTDDGDGLTYKLSSGRGCRLDGEPSRFRRPWLVVADADDRGADAVIRLAGELSERAFRFACGADFETCDVVEWDDRLQQMRALRQTKFAHLVLSEQPLTGKRSPEQLRQAWLSALRVRGLGLLEWDRTATQLLERMRTFAYFFPEADGLDWSEAGLLASAADWLGDALSACRTVNELKKINVGEALRHMVQYSQWREQWRSFEQSLPTHWIVPSGSRIAIDYSDPQAPVLAVRLQELFGLRQSPRLADGRIPLVLHLLSPARRPIQVTRDLESFWRNTYPEVRKELRGRYPKHVWPEDPYQAAPTARAKPRNSG